MGLGLVALLIAQTLQGLYPAAIPSGPYAAYSRQGCGLGRAHVCACGAPDLRWRNTRFKSRVGSEAHVAPLHGVLRRGQYVAPRLNLAWITRWLKRLGASGGFTIGLEVLCRE